MKGIALLLLCAAAAAQVSSSDHKISPNRKLIAEKQTEKQVRSQSASEICAAEDSEGLFFESEYCDKYYKCNHGKPVIMPCAPRLLWYGPFCLWFERVNCGDRIKPDWLIEIENAKESSEELTGADAYCATFPMDLWPHENCNQFYSCNFKQPIVFDCPANLFFNPEKQQCDWPVNVDCGDRIVPKRKLVAEQKIDKDEEVSKGNSDPSQAPAICAVEDSDGVLVAHENCNQFYKCYAGGPVAIDCPENLLYNPEREYCDWTWNVDCGDRIVPSDKVILA